MILGSSDLRPRTAGQCLKVRDIILFRFKKKIKETHTTHLIINKFIIPKPWLTLVQIVLVSLTNLINNKYLNPQFCDNKKYKVLREQRGREKGQSGKKKSAKVQVLFKGGKKNYLLKFSSNACSWPCKKTVKYQIVNK